MNENPAKTIAIDLKDDVKISLSKLIEYCIRYDGINGRWPEHAYEGRAVLRDIFSYLINESFISDDLAVRITEDLEKIYED